MARYCFVPIARHNKKDPLFQQTAAYLERLRHYRPCELVPLKPSTAEKEGQAVIQQVGRGTDVLIALDERGRQLSTLQLRAQVEQWEQRGASKLYFVIGGAYGLSDEVRRRADFLWSLGQLTLPHRLALTVVVEQIYRVHTIIRGEPYHHA